MKQDVILFLFGGCSTEHDISLQSAHAVLSHLDRARHTALTVGITRDGRWLYYTGDPGQLPDGSWERIMKKKSFLHILSVLMRIQMAMLAVVLAVFLVMAYRTAEDKQRTALGNYTSIYKSQIENRLSRCTDVLSELLYGNTDLDMLRSSSEAERQYAAVNLSNDMVSLMRITEGPELLLRKYPQLHQEILCLHLFCWSQMLLLPLTRPLGKLLLHLAPPLLPEMQQGKEARRTDGRGPPLALFLRRRNALSLLLP